MVEIQRRADLLYFALVHDHHFVRHGHCFHLIVGDVDNGGTNRLVQRRQFLTHAVAQLGVEVGQRFIKQKHLRSPDDRPAERHPLALATGELTGFDL
ncbi:hypothetical protein D3C80_1591500 [compost metagenome]